jgi:hypothetical protein
MENKNNAEDQLCPSYISKPGAQLFGIVADGQVQYLDEVIVVDKTFTEAAKKGRSPESRFRFAGKCIKGSCAQWNDGKGICGLADKLIDRIDVPPKAELQHCAIRENCRWFSQRQGAACAICSETVRNLEEAFLAGQ